MIVADTSILSTFAVIGRLDLLFAVAEIDALHLSPAVVKELQVGLNKGLDFLQPIVDGLDSGMKFYSATLTPDEKTLVDTLPNSLNAGERESIAICSQRSGSKLLTNDKRAHNYCRENQIPSLDLRLILRQLWKAGHCEKVEVRSLMEEIEKKEPGMVIKGKGEILR
jgi:predicted nucleic acid-binding protein